MNRPGWGETKEPTADPQSLADAYRELMAEYRLKEAGEQQPADALCIACSPWHRRRFHEGRKLMCTMGGCACRGFVERSA